MDLDLKDRVVLVSGASEGIGRAIGEAFAKEGARVVLTARRANRLDATVDRINKAGGDAVGIPADLTRAEEVEALFAQLAEGPGRLDVLVNNVGAVVEFAGFEQITESDWSQSFDVNVMTSVRLTRGALPLLRGSDRGRILFVGSLGAKQPTGVWPHYNATKAAMVNLAKSLAMQLAKERINVNAISPGPIWTESWDREAAQLAGREGVSIEEAGRLLVQSKEAKVPLGRIGTPADVAGLCLFLSSPHAGWITGANIAVDGGMQRAAV
jgi:NAD(P)-dependent dehydrogenase (short-subunit alcohol dehydrogenase family)